MLVTATVYQTERDEIGDILDNVDIYEFDLDPFENLRMADNMNVALMWFAPFWPDN